MNLLPLQEGEEGEGDEEERRGWADICGLSPDPAALSPLSTVLIPRRVGCSLKATHGGGARMRLGVGAPFP